MPICANCQTFQGRHHFTLGQSSSAYITGWIVCAVALVLYCIYNQKLVLPWFRSGKWKPEYRMQACFVGGILFPVSLFWVCRRQTLTISLDGRHLKVCLPTLHWLRMVFFSVPCFCCFKDSWGILERYTLSILPQHMRAMVCSVHWQVARSRYFLHKCSTD